MPTSPGMIRPSSALSTTTPIEAERMVPSRAMARSLGARAEPASPPRTAATTAMAKYQVG